MNKPIIYYHLWRNNDWKDVNESIFTKIVESGLSEAMEFMHICVNDTNPTSDINLHGLPEDKVTFRVVADTKTEWPTLQELFDECSLTPDIPVLYMHSKGVSYSEDNPRRNPVRDWVAGLTYYLVEDWRTCMSMLRLGAPSVGANLMNNPRPHYSGNFWWVNSTVLSGLANPKYQDQGESNRFGAEFWIGGLGIANLRNNGLVGFDYFKNIPRSLYAKPTTINRSDRNICVHVDNNLDLKFLKDSGIPHDLYRNTFASYAMSYLTYIIENYENLPEQNFFVRTSQIPTRIPNILDVVERTSVPSFSFLSNQYFVSDRNGAPHHQGLPIQSFWNEVFEDVECQQSFKFGAGCQFVVTREAIQSNSFETYTHLLSLISKTVNPLEDYVLERIWGAIFEPKTYTQATSSSFDMQVFIFNYGLIESAIELYMKFNAAGVRAYILNSSDGNDDEIPDEDYIYKFDNIYYSGLWNEALSMFDGTHMMVVTSDVKIPDANLLVLNAKKFFKSDKCWIYAPNVNYTFWNYDQDSLMDYSKTVKIVPNTDGMCWALSSDAAWSVGNVDNEVNKIGFGIDLLACMFANREGKIVGRDYSICVQHPATRSYDSGAAEQQEFEWVNDLGYYKEYIEYRNGYAMSFVTM